MKKLTAIVLCAAMLMSITACGSKNTTTAAPTTTTAAPTTTTAAATTTTEAATTTEAVSTTEADTTTEEVWDTTAAADNETVKAIVAKFEEMIKDTQDATAILNAIQEISVYGDLVQEFPEGYINGFDDEVKGFKKCTGLLNMAIAPFACYIFEADNAEAYLNDTLLKQANPRWNICVEADEPIYVVSGNYILFLLFPNADFI